MNKAQGNTFWIIVAAIIALVVLIVVLVIFGSKIGDVGEGLTDCEGKQGVCYKPADGCPTEMVKSTVFSCSAEAKTKGKTICCLGTKK
tara:strand:+ start:235 stop:498 length:264 start_codon:yes stop_codon:yes gene_type:complete